MTDQAQLITIESELIKRFNNNLYGLKRLKWIFLHKLAMTASILQNYFYALFLLQ